MSDSDSDSGLDWVDYGHCSNLRNDTVIALRPSEEVFDRWGHIPDDTKRGAGQRMKVCTFWLPILLQPEELNHTAHWAVQIGLVDGLRSEDLSLKNIHRIEIIEAILRALEKGSMKRDQTKHIFWISNMFNLHSPEVLDDALHWLERTGEPAILQRALELGHKQVCFAALHLVFTEFAKFIQDISNNFDRTVKSLLAKPPKDYVEKSEEMKKKGNENFQKSQYDDAVKFYSKAIKYYPDNHIIYGNRALCYIRCKKYLKAVGDGKRATLIKPLWAKGHYRYCEALFSLGEIKKAIEANSLAQSLCKDDHDGIKDLEQQHFKFVTEMRELKVGKSKNKNKRLDTCRADAADSQPLKMDMKTSLGQKSKVSEVKKDKQPGKNEQATQMKSSTKDPKPSKSEVSTKSVKMESSTTAQKKLMNRNCQSGKENQMVADNTADVCKELRSLVQDAHTALTDLRSRNAEQAFSRALAILETKTLKVLGLSTMDMMLLLYGRASALTEIGQPEELTEAKKLMEKINSFEERTFQCLVYYAIGKVYLKENRFAVALEQFSDSLQMVKNQITPGKLTWPLTKEIVKETQPEYFMEILENAIEVCKFPPIPDAVCRFEKGHSILKAEIYITDPDFKGYIQICCCQNCTVEYHITCWKTLKTSTFFEKNEKDFLQEACLTPDCVGQICSIRIIGPTGLLKCKFDATIPKPQTPRKLKVNQKCSSLKKLQVKAERKLRKKQNKQSFQEKQTINDDILQRTEDTATQSQQKAWLLYRDRVLLQISQKMDLLKEEKGLQVSALASSLKPWLELDSMKGNQLAKRMLNWQQEPLETLEQAVELLLARQNRVWARVFIELLSSLDVNPKLSKWACQINDAGLGAARSFIERYAGHLEQLDLGLLLSFGPLQERILMKLGSMPEIFSSNGLTVTDYLKQAPPHDMRLFIWTLEEHRDEYGACHTILDEYFDMMDGHCSVLKKSDENQNNSPMKTKNRGRKKKLNVTTGLYGFPQARNGTPRDDWDHDLFEDDSLSFLHPGDPFSVPSHLREQVADFEEQYNSTSQQSCYKKILDNHPDPTKESLYDYFAQILEEHGPLVAEDPLLVGELEYFPPEAQLKIRDAGGFESFLLESLRFIKNGKRVGLAKHAVSLQQAGLAANLDDLDVIVDLDTHSQTPDFHEPVFPNYLHTVSSARMEVYPSLPNPLNFGFCSVSEVAPSALISKGNDPFTHCSNGHDSQQQFPYFSCRGGECELHDCKSDDRRFGIESSEGVTSWTPENNLLRKHAAVQTYMEAVNSVAVNTEPHECFERYQGDINKKENGNMQLEQQIKKMTSCNEVVQKHKEEIASLEEEIRNITTNTEVTNKELALFQQKLEEEVKKDQKEKKANQELLKSLKQEIDELVEEHGRLAQNIRENKGNYDTKLSDFLELSNQSAAERMSLEDEIKRCKDLITSATRRSQAAQVSVVESSRDQSSYGLYRELANGKAFLTKLDEVLHRHPDQGLEISRSTLRANIQEIEKKIATAEAQFQEWLDQVKNRGRVCEVLLNSQSEPSGQMVAGAAKDLTPQSSASASSVQQAATTSAAEAYTAPTRTQNRPPTRKQEPTQSTVFEKAIERLLTIFPDHTRQDMMRFIQELRSSSGGSLISMELQDVVGGVTQLILDHQEKLSSVRSNIRGRGSPAATPCLVTPPPVWQPVGTHRTVHPNAINVEDPCIICHDDMSPEDICVLECRHSFHDDCIRSWLKEQSTCPTCRDHTLLPDDFPVLSGRRRQAP